VAGILFALKAASLFKLPGSDYRLAGLTERHWLQQICYMSLGGCVSAAARRLGLLAKPEAFGRQQLGLRACLQGSRRV
jgi:hypothetical protein